MTEAFSGPCRNEDPLRLLQPVLRLVMIDAETLIIVNIVRRAAPETDDEPPLRDVVDDRQLLCKADRVHIGANAVEMMLGEPNHIDAELVGKPGLPQGLVDDGAVAPGVTAIRKQEIADLHDNTSCSRASRDASPGLSSSSALPSRGRLALGERAGFV